MASRALTEYLVQRRRPFAHLFGCGAAILAVSLTALLIVFKTPRHLSITGTVALVAGWHSYLEDRQKLALHAKGRSETKIWLDTLTQHALLGDLSARFHPPALRELEDCALLRARTLAILNHGEWRQLGQSKAWIKVKKLCAETAESLFVDALWAAKPLFRQSGRRKDTFARRMAEPESLDALTHLQLNRIKLERLITEVEDNPFEALGGTDPLERAIIELNSLREAEIELKESTR